MPSSAGCSRRHAPRTRGPEDEAALQAQIDQLRGEEAPEGAGDKPKRKPRREPLPDHLRRVEHHHKPEAPPARARVAQRR